MVSDREQQAHRGDDIDQLVDAAFAHHEAGQLDQEQDSEHAEALHLLGLVAYQQGKFPSAIELISRALPELDDLPEAHLILGNALREVGRLDEAMDCYGRAIALDPDYGMAHSNLARSPNDQGLFEAGLESSRRAVELIPDFLGAHVNCAAALLGLERFAEARSRCAGPSSWHRISRRPIVISAKPWRTSAGSTKPRRATAGRSI
jgi:protein O-GlcNAc transferase